MALYTATPLVATNSHGSAAESVPADLDTASHPIISRHWFGVEPPCSIGPIAVEAPVSLRRHRQFEHVHRLGPRAIEELAAELANGVDLDRALAVLADFARLDPETVRQLGGDKFPPAPIHGVER